MSDVKKYYYLKVKENFFDSEEMKVLESMQNGLAYQNFYLKICLLSLKSGGALLFKGTIPYDMTMLSTVLRMNIDTVKTGLEILQKFNLIEIIDNGTVYMSDIQSLIGQSSNEAERVKAYRERIKTGKEKRTKSVRMYKKSTLDIDIDIDTKKDKEIETKDKIPKGTYSEIIKEYEKIFIELKHESPKLLYPAINKKLKNYLEMGISKSDIINAIEKAKQNEWIVNTAGFNIMTILSDTVFSGLLNSPTSSPLSSQSSSAHGAYKPKAGSVADSGQSYFGDMEA